MSEFKAQKTSLSLQVQQYIHHLIETGSYKPGQQLPSEADLASQLSVSRPTLREALRYLEQEGVIVRRQGVGTFVARGYARRLESGLEQLKSMIELAVQQKIPYGFDELEVEEKPADPELADRFQIQGDTPITEVRRVIMAEETPVAYMHDIAPSTYIAPADVDDTFNGSVLDLLKKKWGKKIGQSEINIVAVVADPFLADKLNVEIGQAIQLIEETIYDEDGLPIEYSHNYFVTEYFSFRVVRR
jgi:GntR family transcriptional regulator